MLISSAFAQTAGAAGGAASGLQGMLPILIQFALLGLVLWFFMIRPQQQRLKAHKAKIDAVKKGDGVVTGGGLVGKIVRADDIYVDIELAPGMKVKAVKATLTDVIDPTTAKPAND